MAPRNARLIQNTGPNTQTSEDGADLQRRLLDALAAEYAQVTEAGDPASRDRMGRDTALSHLPMVCAALQRAGLRLQSLDGHAAAPIQVERGQVWIMGRMRIEIVEIIGADDVVLSSTHHLRQRMRRAEFMTWARMMHAVCLPAPIRFADATPAPSGVC